MAKRYRINEMFYSLQGEGIRAGTPNVFVRFSGCNMRCDLEPSEKSPGGFMCDTEFQSGTWYTDSELVHEIYKLWFDVVDERTEPADKVNVIWTGGEPGLQLDQDLVKLAKSASFFQAIESNGSLELPDGLDWICISPKVAEHALKVKRASEIKYVRHAGQGIPVPTIEADHYLISPAFDADGNVSRETILHCVKLVKQNPKWRLSMQQHKIWKVR